MRKNKNPFDKPWWVKRSEKGGNERYSNLQMGPYFMTAVAASTEAQQGAGGPAYPAQISPDGSNEQSTHPSLLGRGLGYLGRIFAKMPRPVKVAAVGGLAAIIAATSMPGGSGKAMAVDPATPYLELRVDAADRAAGVSLRIENSPSPIGSFEAKATYDGTCANVPSPVRPEDFTIEQQLIDNITGTATFSGVSAEGVAAPANLGFLTVRVFGSDTQQCPLSLEILALKDTAGNNLPVSPANVSMSFMRGDAKADGTVNIDDVLFMAQYLVNQRPLCGTEIDLSCVHPVNAASVKLDGQPYDVLKIGDVLLTAQSLAGLRNELYNSSVPQPLYFNINNKGILSTLIYDYSGLLDSGLLEWIIARTYYELTGFRIDEFMNTVLPNGELMLQMVVRDEPAAPSGQFYAIVIDNKIVGGDAVYNRLGNPLENVLDILGAKEFDGGFHNFVIDYQGPADALWTNDYGEGLSALYQALFTQFLQEQHQYNLVMKDTPEIRAILEITPLYWGGDDVYEHGLMSAWFEAWSNPAWKAEVEQNKGGLSVATLTEMITYFREELDPSTYHGSELFTLTPEVMPWVSGVLENRVDADSTRTTFVPSIIVP